MLPDFSKLSLRCAPCGTVHTRPPVPGICAICQDPLTHPVTRAPPRPRPARASADAAARLPLAPRQVMLDECSHIFCEECILSWCDRAAEPTCPLCRAPIASAMGSYSDGTTTLLPQVF